MNCCGNASDTEYVYNDGYAYSGEEVLEDNEEDSAEREENEEVLNTPYSRVTPLFRAIEKQEWEDVLMFLKKGKWKSSVFSSGFDHMKSPAPMVQCKTWVTSYNGHTGREEWSQLPIHAAISYSAPAIVIQELIHLYPGSLRCRDNQGMLPIHLAFGFGSNDAVLNALLKAYPGSARKRDTGDRLPYQCCTLGPNKQRGEVLEIFAKQTAISTQEDMDKSWKKFVHAACQRLDLDDKFTKKDLQPVLLELLEDRKQLLELKKRLKHKFGNQAKAASPRQTSNRVKSASPTPAHTTTAAATEDAATIAATEVTSVKSGAKATRHMMFSMFKKNKNNSPLQNE